MNKKFNIIKISGFKGLVIFVFAIGCLIAGFLTFPGWVCMHIWNFFADYFSQMPVMNLFHGMLLWAIIALSFYALNKGDLLISFGTAAPVQRNDERIREIIRQINENNMRIMNKEKFSNSENTSSSDKTEDDVLNNKM